MGPDDGNSSWLNCSTLDDGLSAANGESDDSQAECETKPDFEDIAASRWEIPTYAVTVRHTFIHDIDERSDFPKLYRSRSFPSFEANHVGEYSPGARLA